MVRAEFEDGTNRRPLTAGNVARHGPTTMATDTGSWWEVERAAFIRERIQRLTRPGSVVADIGCGRASILHSDLLSDRTRVNVDVDPWPEWNASSGLFVRARADALPFRDGCVDLVGSFDMIEHTADDVAALTEQARIVADGGTVVTAVPADPKLWSAHDEAVGHYRRYTVASLCQRAAAAGLAPGRATSFFSFLWLPAFLMRKRSGRRTKLASSDTVVPVSWVIALLASTERWLLRRRDLRFGTSLWAEFQKQSPTATADE